MISVLSVEPGVTGSGAPATMKANRSNAARVNCSPAVELNVIVFGTIISADHVLPLVVDTNKAVLVALPVRAHIFVSLTANAVTGPRFWPKTDGSLVSVNC